MALIFHTRPIFNIDPSNKDSIQLAEQTINSREFSKLISSEHYSETIYENIVISSLRQLIGEKCYVIPYKKEIINKKTGSKNKPDVMVIHKSLQTWFIVELELVKPSFSHAIEQLYTFSNYSIKSVFNRENFDYIKKQINDIDPYFDEYEKLENLIVTRVAEVVLMAEHIPVHWRQKIKEKKITCFNCTFQIYSDENKTEFLRINDEGAFSNIYHKKRVSIDLINRCLVFKNGASFFSDYPDGSHIEIYLESEIHIWKLNKKIKHVKLNYLGLGFPISNMVKTIMLIFRESRFELKYIY